MPQNNHQPNYRYLMVGLALVALSACGSDRSTKPTQVAARVNKDEITIHQINRVLQRIPQVDEANAGKIKEEITQRLIDAELLRQQAVQAGLDHNPEILQTIEATKTETLANAYLATVTASAVQPTDDEVSTYYREHTDLFAQRKVYRVSEILLPDRPAYLPELRKVVDAAKGPDEVKTWLQSKGANFNTGLAVRSTDQFPGDLISSIAKAKERDFLMYPAGAGLTIAFIETASPASLNEAAARPAIRNFLLQQRRAELAKAEVARLRAGAKIELVGVAAEPPKPATATTTPADPASSGSGAIERGVKGLK